MGALLFITGLISALTGSAMNDAKRIKGMELEEAMRKGNFSLSTQVLYDCHPCLDSEYDVVKMAQEIKKDWPGIQQYEAIKVGHMAIAKDLMERDTCYNYFVDEKYKMFDLDKYIDDKYKHAIFDG